MEPEKIYAIITSNMGFTVIGKLINSNEDEMFLEYPIKIADAFNPATGQINTQFLPVSYSANDIIPISHNHVISYFQVNHEMAKTYSELVTKIKAARSGLILSN